MPFEMLPNTYDDFILLCLVNFNFYENGRHISSIKKQTKENEMECTKKKKQKKQEKK